MNKFTKFELNIDRHIQEERNLRSQELFGKLECELQIAEIQLLNEYMNDIQNPVWLPVIYDGYKTMYAVSNTGDIKNIKSGLILKKKNNRDRYKMFNMCLYNEIKTVTIHRLVATAFIPNPHNLPVVNHKNSNKQCNWYKNLEWATYQENTKHAIDNGLASVSGTENPNNKFSEEIIHQTCKMLEEGKSPSEITKKINVSKNVIQGIKEGRLWQDIASQYNIPKPVNKVRPQELKDYITELIFAGYGNREIVQIVGLPDTEHEREYVGLFRRRLFKKLDENPNLKLNMTI